MLQVRVGKRSPQAALRIAVDMAEDPDFPLTRAEAVTASPRCSPTRRRWRPRAPTSGRRCSTGLPASPGVASGEIATSAEAAQAAAEAGRTPILVRAETSPDDVHGMARSAGILTARGGLASHAAVVARGWGIPAVVGAEGLEVGDGEVRIGERVLRAGEVITIDGGTGEVFEGAVAGTTEVVPEARTLLAWAKELGIEIAGPAADAADTWASPEAAPPAGAAPSTDGAVTPDDCIRALGIKGFATTEAIADACRCTPDAVTAAIERCTADGLVATTAGAFRLTDDGKARAADLMTAERDAWGADAATAALDAFLDLDHRVKEIVTAWQMRDEATVNDHSDPDYDAGVLDRLAATHADAMAWLAPLQDARRPLRRLRRTPRIRPRRGPRRRWPLRRLPPRRQLPRRLVRAPRGPHPARRPHPGRGIGSRPRLTVSHVEDDQTAGLVDGRTHGCDDTAVIVDRGASAGNEAKRLSRVKGIER